MKKLLFLFVVLFSSNTSRAQEAVDSTVVEEPIEYIDEEMTQEEKEFSGVNDSTSVVKKNFDQSEVDKLKADPDLNYKQAPTVAESLWDRFLKWLGQFIDSLFEGATYTNVGRTIMITIGIIVIIIVIMLLLKVDAFRVFYSGADQGSVKTGVFHENIHEMDFDKLIREATEKGEYRLGVRLVFLYALKTLADKQMIEWQVGKTNHDYVEELKEKELKTGLNELSFYFDYAWYGGFTINRDIFQRVDGIFKDLKGKVR